MKRLLLILVLFAVGCMEWDYGLEEDFDIEASEHGLFICNEGNFQYGNATLSYYDPETRKVENAIKVAVVNELGHCPFGRTDNVFKYGLRATSIGICKRTAADFERYPYMR